MKKFLLLVSLISFFSVQKFAAQGYSPVAATGYTLDAVAENTTATSTTGGSIDGSNYVLYSAAYGAMMSSTYGLPNSGLLTSGTRTYQLQPYTGPNMLYLTVGTVDSLVLVTPAAYAGLSLLGFSTEGAGIITATIRFTDNSTAVYSSLALPDWFTASANTVINGFDRCSRTSGAVALTAGAAGNPRMVYVDVPISCVNRAKLVKNIKIQNTSARSCIMGISGAAVPVFSPTTSPVTCSNGINGSGTITVSGGIAPFTYTVSSIPVQSNSVASNLGVGVYNYTAQDAGLCAVAGTFAVTQSLVTQPPLNVSANSTNICIGSTVAIGANGAVSYTWSTNSNLQQIIESPVVNTTYTVGGVTLANCYRTGSISVTVNPLPVVSFSGLPASLCANNPGVLLVTSPTGGTLSGQGLVGGVFSPSVAGIGTKTITYQYSDANNCSASATTAVTVNAVPVVTLNPFGPMCFNSVIAAPIGLPLGGTFAGTGITGSVFSPSAAGVGTHTITYTYTDANSCVGSASTMVTVDALPVVTFSMSKTSFCNNAPIQLLSATPNGGTYTATGPGLTGSVFSPTVAGAGTHTLTYTYSDVNNGCTDSKAMTVTVSTCSGIEQWAVGSGQWAVYPNPNNGSFVIESQNAMEVLLINDLGQLVNSIKLEAQNDYSFSIQDLAPGIYFIRSQNENRLKQKIIVLK